MRRNFSNRLSTAEGCPAAADSERVTGSEDSGEATLTRLSCVVAKFVSGQIKGAEILRNPRNLSIATAAALTPGADDASLRVFSRVVVGCLCNTRGLASAALLSSRRRPLSDRTRLSIDVGGEVATIGTKPYNLGRRVWRTRSDARSPKARQRSQTAWNRPLPNCNCG